MGDSLNFDSFDGDDCVFWQTSDSAVIVLEDGVTLTYSGGDIGPVTCTCTRSFNDIKDGTGHSFMEAMVLQASESHKSSSVKLGVALCGTESFSIQDAVFFEEPSDVSTGPGTVYGMFVAESCVVLNSSSGLRRQIPLKLGWSPSNIFLVAVLSHFRDAVSINPFGNFRFHGGLLSTLPADKSISSSKHPSWALQGAHSKPSLPVLDPVEGIWERVVSPVQFTRSAMDHSDSTRAIALSSLVLPPSKTADAGRQFTLFADKLTVQRNYGKSIATVRAQKPLLSRTVDVGYFEVTAVALSPKRKMYIGLIAQSASLRASAGKAKGSVAFYSDGSVKIGGEIHHKVQSQNHQQGLSTKSFVYGPGDVIGCGVTSTGACMFTINGYLRTLVPAKEIDPFSVHAAAALFDEGDILMFNLGNRPFRFDFETFIQTGSAKGVNSAADSPRESSTPGSSPSRTNTQMQQLHISKAGAQPRHPQGGNSTDVHAASGNKLLSHDPAVPVSVASKPVSMSLLRGGSRSSSDANASVSSRQSSASSSSNEYASPAKVLPWKNKSHFSPEKSRPRAFSDGSKPPLPRSQDEDVHIQNLHKQESPSLVHDANTSSAHAQNPTKLQPVVPEEANIQNLAPNHTEISAGQRAMNIKDDEPAAFHNESEVSPEQSTTNDRQDPFAAVIEAEDIDDLEGPDIKQSSTCEDLNATMSALPWRKGEILGRGGFGTVYWAFNEADGTIMAAKHVDVGGSQKRRMESLKALDHEVNMLRKLSHPNIVRYIGLSQLDEVMGREYYILTEYAAGGSVQSVLKKVSSLSEAVIQRYTCQMLKGLQYLHDQGVVHRDVKGGNLLLNADGVVKVADFGAARELETATSKKMTLAGTPHWCAPEVVSQEAYSLSADIWSVGITIIEMATGRPPLHNLQPMQVIFRMINTTTVPDPPRNLSDQGQDFVRRTLQRDPKLRPTAKQLLTHPWVAAFAQ